MGKQKIIVFGSCTSVVDKGYDDGLSRDGRRPIWFSIVKNKNLFKIIKYLNFLFKASDQHGVHSPFVYDFVTKCLYLKPRRSSSKAINVLLNSLSYFKVKNFWLPSNSAILQKQVQLEFPGLTSSKPYDLVFIEASALEQQISELFENIHNDSVLLVNSIYKNQTNSDRWEKIKKHKKARVTIDMYHCGAIFFRQEQALEHFKIRI